MEPRQNNCKIQKGMTEDNHKSTEDVNFMKILNFCVPTGSLLKNGQNEVKGKMRCILKLTNESVNHMQSFKGIRDIVQNGFEVLRETAS